MYNMEDYNSRKVTQQQQQYQDECDRPLTSDDWYQWMQSSSDGICPVVENGKQNSEMKSGITVSENQYYGGDWPEYEDDGEQNKMAWEDEFSMNSLLENDIKVAHISLGGDNNGSSARLDKMFDDMVADSQSNCTDQSDLGSSKYMKHDYPQSIYWNKLDDEISHFLVLDTDQTETTMDTKAPVEASTKQEDDVDEEVSCKASELQDLEHVMTQLTSETRIFFRDSLYRLADNSKQNQNRSGKFKLDYKLQGSTIHQGNSMYGSSDNMELETNVIDRTVAKLMFNEMNCNATDDFCVDSVDFSDESFHAANSFNNSYNQSVQCHNSN